MERLIVRDGVLIREDISTMEMDDEECEFIQESIDKLDETRGSGWITLVFQGCQVEKDGTIVLESSEPTLVLWDKEFEGQFCW